MTGYVNGDVILTKTLTTLDAEPWQQLAATHGADIPAPLGKVHVVLLLDTLLVPDAEAFDLDKWLNSQGWKYVGPTPAITKKPWVEPNITVLEVANAAEGGAT